MEYYVVYYQDYDEIDFLRVFNSKEKADDFAARYSAHFKDRPATVESASDSTEFDPGFHHWRVTALNSGDIHAEDMGYHTYGVSGNIEQYTARNVFGGPTTVLGYRTTVVADTAAAALEIASHKLSADLQGL